MQQDAAGRTHAQVRVQLGVLRGIEHKLADLLQDAVDAGQVGQAGERAGNHEISCTA
jgi:hypothetical protein